MKRCFKLLTAVFALALFCMSGTAFAADTIKIGMLAPLTGFAAADGFSAYESVKLAVEKVNAKGGVLGKKVQLICYDDAADPKQSVALAQKLAATPVKVNSAHPGWVRTDLGGSKAPMTVEAGARTAVMLATLPAEGPTGQFFHQGERLPW